MYYGKHAEEVEVRHAFGIPLLVTHRGKGHHSPHTSGMYCLNASLIPKLFTCPRLPVLTSTF